VGVSAAAIVGAMAKAQGETFLRFYNAPREFSSGPDFQAELAAGARLAARRATSAGARPITKLHYTNENQPAA
jgi:hypothetical protein